MDFINGVIEFYSSNSGTIAVIATAALAASETLAAIPSIQSNALYQLILNGLKALAKKD